MYVSMKDMCILSGLKKRNIIEHVFCMGSLWGFVVEGAEKRTGDAKGIKHFPFLRTLYLPQWQRHI